MLIFQSSFVALSTIETADCLIVGQDNQIMALLLFHMFHLLNHKL